ncbi:MAG: type II secretion system F family protein [Hyphomicrobiales bacterium]|nr:type II secretion system F family protein [Hyphomicrobiales bacterium]MCP5371611.1 type II secretion system F family protein [Hyphomicrobiales bacterium]
MTPQIAIIFVGVLLTLGAIGFALMPGASAGKNMSRRVNTVHTRLKKGRTSTAAGVTSLKRASDEKYGAMEKLAKRVLPRSELLRERIERAGLKLSIGGYMMLSLVILGVVFAGTGLVASLPLLMAGFIALACAVTLPHWMLGHMGRRRINKFNALFPDAIDLIVRGLRSGLPVSESIAAVGREMPDPIGQEFRRVSDGVRFGQTLEQVLWNVAKRLDTPEFKFFVISLSVQQETGGNLAETLANLADILRKRRQMRLKIRAISSEARASAYILGSLPLIMFALLYLINPDYESILFLDPRGRMVAGGGLLTMGMGVFVMSRMVRFEI